MGTWEELCKSSTPTPLKSSDACSQQKLDLAQQDASLCTDQGLGFPCYYGTEQHEPAFDGYEVEVELRDPNKVTRVDNVSTPCLLSWQMAHPGFASESSRVRKQRFKDVLESCKQKVEAMAESPVSFQEGEDGVGGIVAGGGGGGADGMRLVQLLVACAEAVACRDRAQAAARPCTARRSSAWRRASCRAWRTGWRWAPRAWRSASRGGRAGVGGTCGSRTLGGERVRPGGL
jgi:hypothetical protein